MAYTQAQLVAAYTAANNGVAPDAGTTALLGAFATQTQTGQLSDNAALAYVINSSQDDVQVAVQAYQFFTGKTPTKAGLDYLVNSTTNTNDLNDAYYAQFGLENRYINFAANLGVVGEGAANFASTYGAMSFTQFVGVAYETIIGSAYAQAAGINVPAAIADVTARQANFTAIARQAGIINTASTPAQVDIATKAALIGYLMAEGVKADVGVYAAGANNFVQSLVNGTAQYNVNLITTYSTLGGGTGSPVGGGALGGTVGSTIALTGGIDNLTGTANDDTFNGQIITGATATNFTTFSAADTINGGNGNDTLNIVITDAGAGAFAATTVPAASVNGVENINIRSINAGAANANATTISATTFTGATLFNNDRSTQGLVVNNLGTNQGVGITGNGASTVGGVTADYNSSGATANTAYNAVVTLAGGTGDGSVVTLGSAAGPGGTPAAVPGANSTNPNVTITSTTGAVLSATINSNGAANTIGTLQLDATDTVRTLQINANSNLTVLGGQNAGGPPAVATAGVTGFGGAASGTNAASTTGAINVTGTGNVTLNGVAGAAGTFTTLNITTGTGTLNTGTIANGVFAAGATINVSGASTTATAGAAAVTLGTIGANVSSVNAAGLTAGGAAVTIGGAAGTTFQGGAGTDVVTFANGTGAAQTGVVAGNGGTDIIAFNTGADLAANLTPIVTGFETLRVGGTGTYDPTLINGITSYQINTGTSLILNNLVANPTVTVIGNQTTALTLNLANASGATDVINLRLDNLATTGANVAGVTVAGLAMGGNASAGQVETLNITSAGRNTGTGAYNQVTLAAGGGPNFPDANTVKVLGANGLALTTGAVQHNQLIDASGSTGGLALTATTAAGAGGSLTIVGSAKNDSFTFGAAVVTASIYGGAGGNSINLGAAANGVQTIVYKAASNSTLDLTGTVSATGNVGASGTGGTVNAGTMDIINLFNSTVDKIDVSTFGFGAGGLGGGIVDKGTVASDAAFNALLTAPGVFSDGITTRGLAVIHGTAAMSSGVAGDFLLIDANKDGAFTAGTDIAVKLTGITGGTGALVITDFVI